MIPTFSFFLKYLTERKDKKLRNSAKIGGYNKKMKNRNDWTKENKEKEV